MLRVRRSMKLPRERNDSPDDVFAIDRAEHGGHVVWVIGSVREASERYPRPVVEVEPLPAAAQAERKLESHRWVGIPIHPLNRLGELLRLAQERFGKLKGRATDS